MIAFLVAFFLGSPLEAKELPNPPRTDAALVGFNGLTATAAPNLKSLSRTKYKDHEREYLLKDGTKLGGLYFERYPDYPAPLPLIIVNFGSLSDRWSSAASAFIKDIALGRRINANFLVVDSISGAGFYAANQSLSLGGYDEGRIMVELAAAVEEEGKIPTPSMHLMGVSLGGAAVLQALLEDARLGTGYFQSAITFSGVTHQDEITNCVLQTFNYTLENAETCKLGWSGTQILKAVLKHYNATWKALSLTPLATESLLTPKNAGQVVHDLFQKRLEGLKTVHVEQFSWNESVSRDSVGKYLTTSTALVSQAKEKIQVPLIVIHGRNDPIVPYEHFERFAAAVQDSENIMTHGTRTGGHWGYLGSHGIDWVVELLNRILPQRLTTQPAQP